MKNYYQPEIECASPEQIKAKFNVPSLESLTKTQCSRAIDELSGKAA